jgi:hypothetical protein
MNFASFVKKHFPLNHPLPMRPKVKARKKRRTVSGYSAGEQVSYRSFNGTLVPCTIRRTWGRYIYLQPSVYPNETWCVASNQVQPLHAGL